MQVITDINRPDVNGQQPKMYAIESLALAERYTDLIPYIRIDCDDNILSCVSIKGSFDQRPTWKEGIWENSEYFGFLISDKEGKRYYIAGEPVTVELMVKSHKIAAKFRTFTGTPEKAIAKVKQWLLDNR